MSLYRGDSKVMGEISVVNEEKVKEIVDSEMTAKGVCTTKVADVAETTITFSDETYYKPYGDGKRNFYLVKNGICYVSIDVTVVSSTTSWRDLYSLPTPNISLGLITSIGTFDDTTTVKNLTLLLNGAGGLNFKSGESGSRYSYTFSYPVAES